MAFTPTDFSALRQRHIAARRRMTSSERASASDAICRRLSLARVFSRSRHIAAYLAMSDEVNLDSFIRAGWASGKRIYVPRILPGYEMQFTRLATDTRIVRNRFGIWEPEDGDSIDAHRLEWVIVPLVAFDKSAHRIGMGGGYYDRAFAFLRHKNRILKPRLSGVAFACQEMKPIAPNPWDIGLSRVYTETL